MHHYAFNKRKQIDVTVQRIFGKRILPLYLYFGKYTKNHSLGEFLMAKKMVTIFQQCILLSQNTFFKIFTEVHHSLNKTSPLHFSRSLFVILLKDHYS